MTLLVLFVDFLNFDFRWSELIGNCAYCSGFLCFIDAIETKDYDIGKDACEAGERIDYYVSCATISAGDSELMDFVERAPDNCKNNWIEDVCMFWESERMKPFNKTASTISKCAV